MLHRLRYLLLLGILALGLGFHYYGEPQKDSDKEEVVLNLVYQVLKANHLAPKELNDEFSAAAFDNFIEALDYNKRFLLAEDIKALQGHRLDIDDQVARSQLGFFEAAYQIYQKRYEQVKAFYPALLAEPFDLERREYLETDDEKREFAKDSAALRDYWRQYFKQRVLSRMDDRLEEQESDSTLAVEPIVELEKKAREKELELHRDWFKSLDDMNREDWLAAYINALTTLYDPHTQYFAPERKEDFEINMTGQLQGIGAQLQQKGDYITVSKVIVGSPCWKQGDLEVGDKIIKVEQEDGEATDLVGMSVRKAVKFIRGPKGTVVTLSVRKVDGSRQEIPITRDVVELESTFARSSVLGEGEDKVGYIHLPKFYVNFYGEDNHNCAEDVKLELEKLKAEGVKSVILDLRNNGGGSLQGVVDIVGLFIDRGPVVQVKASNQPTRVLNDRSRGTVYDGPLVVMVNQFSASASEIFAAAIQDYKRGIIIGSPSTFGKGTVQNVVDLDRAVSSGYRSMRPFGGLKLTIQKYYRINGGTPQMKGVEPDIVVPDNYMYIPYGEREQNNALAYSEIEPAEYETWALGNQDFPRIIASSQKRIDQHPRFGLIEEYAAWIRDEREKTKIPLQWEAYRASQVAYRAEAERYTNMRKSDDSLAVSTNEADLAKINASEEAETKQENWHKSLRRDLYLHEAFQVARDVHSAIRS